MPVLAGIENLLRSCNKNHTDDFFEVGIFYPDYDDYAAQKLSRQSGQPSKPPSKVKPDDKKKPSPIKEEDKLDQEEEDLLRKIFNQHKDADGLPREKGTKGAHLCGSSPSKEEEEEWMKESKDKASFEDFKNYVERTQHSDDSLDDMVLVFKYWDPEGTDMCHRTHFTHGAQCWADKLSQEDAEWITDNFTDTDNAGMVNYRDGVRRLLENPEGFLFKGIDSGSKTVATPPLAVQGDDDFVTVIYNKNTASSPSGQRRRTSQFKRPMHEANIASISSDFPNQEYMSEAELRGVIEQILNRHSEAGMIEYFEFYDPNSTGTVSRQVAVWQVQGWGDHLTEQQAEQVVTLIEEKESGRINYRDFVRKLMARPGNSKLQGLTPEMKSSAAPVTPATNTKPAPQGTPSQSPQLATPEPAAAPRPDKGTPAIPPISLQVPNTEDRFADAPTHNTEPPFAISRTNTSLSSIAEDMECVMDDAPSIGMKMRRTETMFGMGS